MRIPCSLKMVGRSFIISIGLICLIFSAFPASGYIFDFEEGTGPSWIYEGEKNWYRISEGHNSSYSMMSGDINCKETSSISRWVKGDGKEPIEISFSWKKGGTAITNFAFSVDGRVERTCRSYEWDEERYTIPEDDEMHEIRWDFEKQTCHLQGYGRIDDIIIKSSSYEESYRALMNDEDDVSHFANMLNFTNVKIDPSEIFMCDNSGLYVHFEFVSFQEIVKVHRLVVETPDVIELIEVVNSDGFLENATFESGNIYNSNPISASSQGSLDILYKISSDALPGKYFINVTKFEAETITGRLIRDDLGYSAIIVPEQFDLDSMELTSGDGERWNEINRNYQYRCGFN